MSGGRFGYAYIDARDLQNDIERMLDFLDGLEDVDEAEERLEELQDVLDRDDGLLYGVEWVASGDWSPERFREDLEEGDL